MKNNEIQGYKVNYMFDGQWKFKCFCRTLGGAKRAVTQYKKYMNNRFDIITLIDINNAEEI